MGLIDYYLERRYKKIVDKYLVKYKAIRGKGENTEIHCNCERWVKVDDIVDIHPVNVNTFNWWTFQLLDKKDRKNNKDAFPTKRIFSDEHKPYCYIGYVPLLREIPYYCHLWFAKKDYALSIECKFCEDDEE